MFNFFVGKNNVMSVALGRSKENEVQKNLHKISACLKGQCGLMFTNATHNEVVSYFENYKHTDFARGGMLLSFRSKKTFGFVGQVATHTVQLEEGLLEQFSFSMEPQLRKLGLPTKLEKGQVTIIIFYNFLIAIF